MPSYVNMAGFCIYFNNFNNCFATITNIISLALFSDYYIMQYNKDFGSQNPPTAISCIVQLARLGWGSCNMVSDHLPNYHFPTNVAMAEWLGCGTPGSC